MSYVPHPPSLEQLKRDAEHREQQQRLTCLQMAVGLFKGRGDMIPNSEVINTANRFQEYIKTGN